MKNHQQNPHESPVNHPEIAGRGQAYVRYSRHDEAAKCLAANPFTEDLSVPWFGMGKLHGEWWWIDEFMMNGIWIYLIYIDSYWSMKYIYYIYYI